MHPRLSGILRDLTTASLTPFISPIVSTVQSHLGQSVLQHAHGPVAQVDAAGQDLSGLANIMPLLLLLLLPGARAEADEPLEPAAVVPRGVGWILLILAVEREFAGGAGRVQVD